MNDWLIPLLTISAIGLFVVLVRIFNNVDAASRILEKDATTSPDIAKRYAYLRTAKYLVYIPAIVLVFVAIVFWQKQRSEKQSVTEKIKREALAQFDTAKIWEAPDPLSIKQEDEAKLGLTAQETLSE